MPEPSCFAAPPIELRFDRGTLLFAGGLRDSVARWLPGATWDARTGSYRAPPWRHAEIVRVARALGVPLEDRAAQLLAIERSAWHPIPLRPYQRAALTAWEAAGRRGVVELPTGSGKTRLAIAAIAAAGISTLCLVPTRVLLHQWRAELGRFYRGAVGIWGDGERVRAPLMVITFESAYRNMQRLGRHYGLVVVDEAHHFGTGIRDEALEMTLAPARLGLSATLPESADARAGIEQLIGPVVYRASIDELAGKYLANFDVRVLHLPLNGDERRRYAAEQAVFRPYYASFARTNPGASWSDFVAAAGTSPEGRAALAAWRESRRIVAFTRSKAETVGALLAQHRGRRLLLFTADNDTAYAIARRFLVMPLTCEIGRKEREHALGRFRRGELSALVSARVLNEGIDVPDADVAIIVGGSHGKLEHVQRIGRLLRPREGKRAIVYELVSDGTSETRQSERRRLGLGTAQAASL